MGVYIKGMEMPRSCISCHLNFGEKRPEYGLTIYCPYSDGVISWRDKAFDNGRLASCGIISVPPHGKLGDLDVLVEKAWDADTRCGYVQVVDVGDILDAPTIIEADKAVPIPPKSKEQQDLEDVKERKKI